MRFSLSPNFFHIFKAYGALQKYKYCNQFKKTKRYAIYKVSPNSTRYKLIKKEKEKKN